jgi:hypothetical protein
LKRSEIGQSAAKSLKEERMALDASWFLNQAHIIIGTPVTGEIDMSTEDLMTCLENVTLPIFSSFLPHEENVEVDLFKDRAFKNQEGIYVIRAEDGGAKLIGVSKVIDFEFEFGTFPRSHNPFDLIANDHFEAATRGPSTFKFTPPNTLEIFPKYWNSFRGNILVRCKFIHENHLQTVPMGAMETLKNLYLGDVATHVIARRRHFAQMNTPHGDIELHLEDLESAITKREDVIVKLRETQHMLPTSRRIIVA